MAEKLYSTEDLHEIIVEDVQEIKVQRPRRVKLTAEESLKRMEQFPERKEQIVAAVRKNKSRSLPA